MIHRCRSSNLTHIYFAWGFCKCSSIITLSCSFCYELFRIFDADSQEYVCLNSNLTLGGEESIFCSCVKPVWWWIGRTCLSEIGIFTVILLVSDRKWSQMTHLNRLVFVLALPSIKLKSLTSFWDALLASPGKMAAKDCNQPSCSIVPNHVGSRVVDACSHKVCKQRACGHVPPLADKDLRTVPV